MKKMKKAIQKKCKEIERKEKFTILFAVESGSRLWRIAGKDSDYDIRLVFHYPMEDYLSLRRLPQTYQWMSEDQLVDISGFDLYKYCRLLLQSNPNMIDWTLSDIIYYGNRGKISPLVQFVKKRFNPYTLYNY
jgi:predicted nucleotidyltransferase